jgi:uncharacterized membrane protein
MAKKHAASDRVDVPGPQPVESVAAVGGHPLHPVVVPLPIGSFVGAFLCDLAFARTQDAFWARGARVLTGAGIVTGLLAGSLGAVDFTGRREVRTHRGAWAHAGGNLAVLALSSVSEVVRTRDTRSVPAPAMALSAMSALILLGTGWLGGELAYRDRIGVTRQ